MSARRALSLCLALLLCASAPARAQTRIVVGTVPNVGDGTLVCAIEKGLFAEQGLAVEIAPFRTASDMMPLVARGDLAIIGGGVSAAYFNAVARGLPVRYFVNRTRAPVHHMLAVRAGLDDVRSLRDLAGRRVAITAAGGLSEYELAMALQTVGLTIDSVETKALAMPQTIAALKNGAIDAAVLVPPFDTAAIEQGARRLAQIDALVKPRIEVSGLIYNLDWAQKNPDTLDRFTLAYIKGVRCFLEASRDPSQRRQMAQWLVKYSPVKDASIFADMAWQDVHPDGRVSVESLEAQQDFYIRRGYLKGRLPLASLLDQVPVERALQKLGALEP